MLHVYIVKPGESAASIAAKFGGSESDLIRVNSKIPRKIVYYAGQPYTVFKNLYIGQQLIIPYNWINRKFGLGDSSIAVQVNTVGQNAACNFDLNSDPNTVTTGSNVCALGLNCVNNICVTPGVTNPTPQTVLCTQDSDCGSGSYCDTPSGTCVVGQNSNQPTQPQPQDNTCQYDEDCASGSYCDDNSKTCTIGQRPNIPPPSGQLPITTPGDNTTVSGNCTDDSVIRFVQSAVSVNADGHWGCKSQNALDAKGFKYTDVVNRTGNPPDPCAYGQCVSGQCPTTVSGGTSKKIKHRM